MKFHVFILLIVTCLSQSATAQVKASFQIRHYTTEEGLLSNGIKGLEWDEQTGFLWIGTEAGIQRYNGRQARSYTPMNTPFLQSERILKLMRNNKGVIHAVDDFDNTVRIQDNEIEFYRKGNPLERDPFLSIVATAVSDTFLNYKIGHPLEANFPFFLTAFVVLTDTSMYFSGNGKSYKLTITDNSPVSLPFQEVKVTAGFKIDDHLFLTSESNEIFLADINTGNLQPIPIKGRPAYLNSFSKNKTLFFGSTGSSSPIMISSNLAWTIHFDGSNITLTEICDTIPTNADIHNVQYSEKLKKLFIGTGSKGVIIISRNNVTAVYKKQNKVDEKSSYYAQYELSDGRILAHHGDIIGHATSSTKTKAMTFDFLYNIYRTPDSIVWFVQMDSTVRYQCLQSLNYKTGEKKIYKKIQINQHFGLVESKGKIFIATDSGFGILQGDSVQYLLTSNKGIFNAMQTMLEISPSKFAIATCQRLLLYDLVTGKTETILDVGTSCIRSLWQYNGYLFIGTYGRGYFIYKAGRIKSMPLDKNKFLLYSHCFISDSYGYCWISTNRGLFKSKLEDLIHSFENDTKEIYHHYIGRNDGMGITEMNGGCTPCALYLSNGIISFPTMDGLLWVDPLKMNPALPFGKIFIDGFQADNGQFKMDSIQEVSLPANTQEILVKLAIPAWCNKENQYIGYRLDENVEWQPVNEEASIVLHNLAYGSHKLNIRKINGFGSDNYSYKHINFNIETPWNRKWWFYLLIAIGAICLIGLGIKLRTMEYTLQQRKLQEQVAEKTKELLQQNELLEKNDTIKTRLISIISHDIITPLKFLTVTGKKLLQKQHLMTTELQQETIREMTNTSQELQLLSTNILNWIKYQNENRRLLKETFYLHDLVNDVMSVLTSLAKQKGLHLSNEIDSGLKIYQYKEPLSILIYNILVNSINYSDAGTIIVSNHQHVKNLTIVIKDEGIGMTPDEIQNVLSEKSFFSPDAQNRKGNGLGYLIIKDLLKMIGASIRIDSKKDEGTAVSIHIPLT